LAPKSLHIIFPSGAGSNRDEGSEQIRKARIGMGVFAALGIGIALLQPQLLWVFLIYGALASSLFLPAFLALFWKKLTGQGAAIGIFGGFLIGTPLSIFANVKGDTDLIVTAAVLSVLVSGVLAIIVSLLVPKKIV